MRITPLLFLAQLGCTLFLTGLIWFVQVVHYPLFSEVGAEVLPRYETLHAERTSWVVFPPMVLELGASLAMIYAPLRPAFVPRGAALLLAALVGVIWLTTAAGHVPLHTKLGRPSNLSSAPVIGLLVRLNWIRTIAWTLRSGLLLALLSRFPLIR